MFDKLEDLLHHYEELMNTLSEPDVANDPNRFRKLMKEQSDLQPDVYKRQVYAIARYSRVFTFDFATVSSFPFHSLWHKSAFSLLSIVIFSFTYSYLFTIPFLRRKKKTSYFTGNSV